MIVPTPESQCAFHGVAGRHTSFVRDREARIVFALYSLRDLDTEWTIFMHQRRSSLWRYIDLLAIGVDLDKPSQ